MIRYQCPKCGTELESPDSIAGQEDSCSVCGQASIVPSALPTGSVMLAMENLARKLPRRVAKEVMAFCWYPLVVREVGILIVCLGITQLVVSELFGENGYKYKNAATVDGIIGVGFLFLCVGLHLGKRFVRWTIVVCGAAYLGLILLRIAINDASSLFAFGNDWQKAIAWLWLAQVLFAIWLLVKSCDRGLSNYFSSQSSKQIRKEVADYLTPKPPPLPNQNIPQTSHATSRPCVESWSTHETIVMMPPFLLLAFFYYTWIYPILGGIRIAKAKRISPNWMWFGVYPLFGWIAYFVVYFIHRDEKGA